MADATQVQRRRGTASQCAAMTPAEGELIVNLTDDRVHLGDGLVAGGIVLPNARDLVRQSFTYGISGGTANAITLNIPQLLAYAEGVAIEFRATAANTGAVTIAVNALGTRSIYKNNGLGIIPLAAGDIVNGGIYRIIYDGAQFQLTNAAQQPLVNTGLVLIDTATLTSVTQIVFDNIPTYPKYQIVFKGTKTITTLASIGVNVGNGTTWTAWNNPSSYHGSASVPNGVLGFGVLSAQSFTGSAEITRGIGAGGGIAGTVGDINMVVSNGSNRATGTVNNLTFDAIRVFSTISLSTVTASLYGYID